MNTPINPMINYRVFVVDDHPLVREWLINFIQQHADLQVCGQAEDAPTALAELLRLRPDIVIIDLSLKSGSGLDLIKSVYELCPAIRILVLSMHEETYFAERALRAGARGYVMKKESTGRIIEAIRDVLAGRLYFQAKVLNRLAERAMGNANTLQGSPADLLSDRELEVFRLIGEGWETQRIAESLHLSAKTVQSYCARIKDKLGLANMNELLREAVRWVEASRKI